jgi:hypothetical protein
MRAVHGFLLRKMFSITASLSQEVASTPGLGLSSDASVKGALDRFFKNFEKQVISIPA